MAGRLTTGLSPLAPYVAAGAAMLALAVFIGGRTHERAGRLLAAFLAIEGLHQIAHGAPAITADPRAGQAILNTLHLPSLFGYAVSTLMVTTLTGIHRRFWWSPGGITLLLSMPVALVAVELTRPSPFWTYAADGAHVLQAPLATWSSLEGAVFLLFDVYAILLLSLALRRTEDPAQVPGQALILAFFVIKEATVVVDYLVNPDRWQFMALAGLPSPPPLPAGPALVAAVGAGVALLPSLAARWRAVPAAGDALLLVGLLGALLTAVTELGAAASPARVTMRLLFGAALLGYAATRHGILGVRRRANAALELPLAACAVGLLVVLASISLGSVFSDGTAMAAGVAVALIAAAMTFSISGVGLTGHRTPPDATPGPGGSSRGDLILNRYRLDQALGRSSTGATYLARDLRASRSVVAKIHENGHHSSVLRELTAFARIQDRHVVRVQEVGLSHRGPAIIMEHVAGGSLADRLKLGPLVPEEFHRVATGLLRGLAAVHAAGIVHGDLKPANVLLTANGEPRLADFDAAGGDPDATLGGPVSRSGTPRYLSPERARGAPAGVAGDVYGAAATLFEACTGHPYMESRPNEGTSELVARIAGLGQPHVVRASNPAWAAWFAIALHPDPDHRFTTVETMLASLPAAASGAPGAMASERLAGPGRPERRRRHGRRGGSGGPARPGRTGTEA